jgi:hypothetical protein
MQTMKLFRQNLLIHDEYLIIKSNFYAVSYYLEKTEKHQENEVNDEEFN